MSGESLELLFEELAGTAVGLPPGVLTATKAATSLASKPDAQPSQNPEVHHITSYEADLTRRVLRDYNASDYKFK